MTGAAPQPLQVYIVLVWFAGGERKLPVRVAARSEVRAILLAKRVIRQRYGRGKLEAAIAETVQWRPRVPVDVAEAA